MRRTFFSGRNARRVYDAREYEVPYDTLFIEEVYQMLEDYGFIRVNKDQDSIMYEYSRDNAVKVRITWNYVDDRWDVPYRVYAYLEGMKGEYLQNFSDFEVFFDKYCASREPNITDSSRVADATDNGVDVRVYIAIDDRAEGEYLAELKGYDRGELNVRGRNVAFECYGAEYMESTLIVDVFFAGCGDPTACIQELLIHWHIGGEVFDYEENE